MSFVGEHIHPERLMRLFVFKPKLCATACQSGAVDDGIILDCIRYSEYGIRLVLFMIFFEKEELFDIWQVNNYKHYVCNGTCPWGKEIVQRTFIPLLENILDSANEAIQK